MWFGIAFAFLLGTIITLTVLVIAVIAIWLPLWAAALVVLVLFIALAALTGYIGYKKLDLRGPTRSINSLKETMRWAKARLLGRSASYPIFARASTSTSRAADAAARGFDPLNLSAQPAAVFGTLARCWRSARSHRPRRARAAASSLRNRADAVIARLGAA